MSKTRQHQALTVWLEHGLWALFLTTLTACGYTPGPPNANVVGIPPQTGQSVAVSKTEAESASSPTAPESKEQIEARFNKNCIDPISQDKFEEAHKACLTFISNREWAGKAYTALASIHNNNYPTDNDMTYRYARLAVEQGDAGGKIFAAVMMLQGRWGPGGKPNSSEIKLEQINSWISDTGQSNIYASEDLATEIKAIKSCIDSKESFQLMGEPLFCMPAPMIKQALLGKGMQIKIDYSSDSWTESWDTGKNLQGISRAELYFDESLPFSIPMLSALSYISKSSEYSRLLQILTEKYGKPTSQSRTDSQTTYSWNLKQGLVLALSNDNSRVEIRYSIPERWKSRVANLGLTAKRMEKIASQRDAHAL